MTQPIANCPNCGAKIVFRWSGSVQTVCEFCKSVLIRTDINLQRVGKVADLPPNSSPIQVGTEGVFGNRSFSVLGRIIYEYEQGNWNEWHFVTIDGTSGWLSDAQLNYAVTFPAQVGILPRECKVGQQYVWDGETYVVSTITKAHYCGVEGELPFKYWDKSDVVFIDLMSRSQKFATFDYSEDPPLLFLGEFVDFDDLKLKNLRTFEGWS
ncbi:DUF4178 domain-containing protein [Occallatibacter savannae]|uniref:DUF4178 domain-containing protein n=1 Tax=Occallatibacter savannae TaxID=1002691 RepID=UPI000D696770|nr:DUF4178 domain-containing protein [Occallatibacter savannae]